MEEKKNIPAEGEPVIPEAPVAESPVADAPAPDLNTRPAAPQEQDGIAPADPGDVVVSFDKIEELMAERRAAARAAVEQSEPPAPEAGAPTKGQTVAAPPEQAEEKAAGDKTKEAAAEEQKKPRRGRPPKEEKGEQAPAKSEKAQDAAKPRKGRPPKADKAAPGEAQPPKPRDKMSRSKQAATVKEEAAAGGAAPGAGPAAEAPEQMAPARPIDEGKLVYLKLSELHAFHTFRDHPFQVKDDDKMAELVGTIKEHGVMPPATVRPEKDGNGYEIIAGHRRHRGSELAGLEELPCIVRNMTDIEAVREMKNSNKQRGEPLPSELAKLLDLEVEAIKHQGGRLADVAPGDVGKRSVEIVGENNGMNYKKVMRYIRLNSLVPELMDMVDNKKMGFMPAVEISYIKPKNQQLIAVSIEGEQSSPSHAQAKQLRELDQAGKLNGDVIDGILSEKKKEDRGVIISMAELEKYFGKEVTPAKMKEQIMSLLDDWKENSRPSWVRPTRKRRIWRSNLETLCPEVFLRPLPEGSGSISPVAAYYPAQAGAGRQGGVCPAACGGLPFTARPGCATPQRRDGGYILQSRPLSHEWERAGGLG